MNLAVIENEVPPTPPVGPGYTTVGVHFDGSTWLRRNSALSGWGTPTKAMWCMWTKLSAANDGIFADPSNFYFNQGGTSTGGLTYFNMNVGTSFSYFDTTPLGGPGCSITSASWQGILCSIDLSGAGVAQIYKGDTDVQGYDSSGVSGPDTIPSVPDFYFGQDGFGVKITGDVADFRLWVGQAPDLTLQIVRRRFIRASGKPEDPSVANGVYGAPIISFIGDASSTGFRLNGGSGGAFTMTGTLTNASSSPTD